MSPLPSPVVWDEQGTPTNPAFGDVYRSTGLNGEGGWAQARHVFLGGCGLLPTAEDPVPLWSHQPHWCVLENGFGLGLNFLATWHAWRQDPHRPPHLRYVATEAWLPSAADVVRSAAAFPALHSLAQELATCWPQQVPSSTWVHHWPEGVTLELWPGPALHQLQQQPRLGAKSVFLDGFNPQLNPDMWSAELMQAVAQHAQPGTRASTWCVAALVKRHLMQAGFTLHKRQGLPPKRHSLQATLQTPD